MNNKKHIRFFKTHPEDERAQLSLKIFSILKKGTATISDMVKRTGISNNIVTEYIDFCKGKELLKVSDSEEEEKVITFSKDGRKMLGVGFNSEECILTIMNIDGSIVKKEQIKIEVLSAANLKRKDIKEIINKIREKTEVHDEKFYIAGIAIPDRIERTGIRNAEFLIKEISNIFNCHFFRVKEATAAGYGERDFGWQTKGRDILYLHLDVGAGVIVKNEMIFEADEGDADRMYLRPWHQFSMVATAKSLVDKGVGTSIVDMVGGNADNITLDVVLKAAASGDELAEDLVKRSALALGMRAAYLVNMFTPGTVILGGGLEKKESSFIQYVRESASKFLLKDLADKIQIIYGTLGQEASSLGVGALCRRELFMEV